MLLAGLLAGLAFLGGRWVWTLPFAALALLFAWLNRPRWSRPAPRTGTIAALGVESVPEQPALSTPNFVDAESELPPGDPSPKQPFWIEMQSELDRELFESAQLVRTLLPQTHSVFVFFPGEKPETLQLQIFDSVDSAEVIPNVLVEQGLLTLLFKKDCPFLLEGNLGSTQTHCYRGDVKIRSVAAVPIILEGRVNGAVVVDSLAPQAFTDEVVSQLNAYAKLVCALSYQTSMNICFRREREQYKGLFEYQKKFMDNMSAEEIYQEISAYIRDNIPNDRMMLVIADPDNPGKIRVKKVSGLNAGHYENLEADAEGPALVPLCFHHGMEVINKEIVPGEVVRRFDDSEPFDTITCFTALPVTEEAKGPVRMVICVESSRRPFTEHQINLLRNICNAAGFAYTRVRAYEEKQTQATRDALTGLPNRRDFEENLAREMMRAKRLGKQLGIIMTDVDKFKSVNDTYGHPIGDKVLKMVSGVLANSVRADLDRVARYGGEEFIAVITEADEEIVRTTAERIRAAVEADGVDIGRPEKLRVTISLGYSLYPRDSDEAKALVDKADKALYSAKENGRNRVVGWH